MVLKGGARFGGDTDGQRWEILRSQDYLIEGAGTEVYSASDKKVIITRCGKEKSNEKSIRTVPITLQGFI